MQQTSRSNTDRFRESSQRAHEKQIATKLLDELDRQQEHFETWKRRWIWELLQNAKDVCDGNVKIEIEVDKDYVEFRHSGKPFRMDNIVFLIEQTSSKDRFSDKEIETTGKFGTGFLTTHLLSKKVLVESVYESEEGTFQKFNLRLNRDAQDPNQMIKNVKESYDVSQQLDDHKLCPILKDYKPGQNCDTLFRYELSNDLAREVATTGVKDLEKSIFLTMTFTRKFESIQVNNKVENKVYKIELSEEKSLTENIDLVTFKMGNLTKDILLVRQKELQIALQIDNDMIIGMNKDDPVLFVDFPLIGSEKFCFPAYINSHYFRPNEPRNNILLNRGDLSTNNKNIFQNIINLYQNLTDYAAKNYKNAYILARTDVPYDVDENWFINSIQIPMRKIITKQQIFYLSKIMKVPLSDGVIPVLDSKIDQKQLMVYRDLIQPLYKAQIIDNDEKLVEFWSQCIDKSWEKQLSINVRIDLDSVLTKIQEFQTLQKLKQYVSFQNNDQFYQWLNNLLKFLNTIFNQSQRNDLLRKYNILSNQQGQLLSIQNLYVDDSIPEIYKDICENIGEIIKDKLLDLNIDDQQLNLNLYQPQQVISKINGVLDEYSYSIIYQSYTQHKRSYSRKPKQFSQHIIDSALNNLVSIIPKDNDFQNEKRKEFHIFLKKFYINIPSEQEVPTYFHDLYFKADKLIKQRLFNQVQQFQNVQSLCQQLSNSSQDQAIQWLNKYYYYMEESDDNKIRFPNQQLQFCDRENLKIDTIEKDCELFRQNQDDNNNIEKGNIPNINEQLFAEDFKEIYYLLFGKRKEAELLLVDVQPRFNLYSFKLYSFSDITLEILEAFKKGKAKDIKDQNFIKAVIKFDERIIHRINQKYHLMYFEWFVINYPLLFITLFADQQEKQAITQLMMSGQIKQMQQIIDSGLDVEKYQNNSRQINQILACSENRIEQLAQLTPILQQHGKKGFELIKQIFQEFDYKSNPEDLIRFLKENQDICITSEAQYNEFRSKNPRQAQSYGFLSYSPPQDAYEYVMKIIARAVKNTQDFLIKSSDYDM